LSEFATETPVLFPVRDSSSGRSRDRSAPKKRTTRRHHRAPERGRGGNLLQVGSARVRTASDGFFRSELEVHSPYRREYRIPKSESLLIRLGIAGFHARTRLMQPPCRGGFFFQPETSNYRPAPRTDTTSFCHFSQPRVRRATLKTRIARSRSGPRTRSKPETDGKLSNPEAHLGIDPVVGMKNIRGR
jgi:hypothetical protein